MKFPNRNQVLIAIGMLAVMGPDISAAARWLAASGIPHVEGVVHFLGALSLALGGLALAWPRIRGLLAAGGLATPPGAQAPWNPAVDTGVVPVAPPAPPVVGATPITIAPRRGPYGSGPGAPGAVALLVLAGSLLLASPARAQTLGHCLLTNADGTCKLVVQPDVIKPVLDLNLKTGKVAGGIDIASLGACWGATYQPAAWYASGLDLCFNITGSQDKPTLIYPSGTLHFLNYASVTAGPQCLDNTCQWHLLLGGNLALDFGPNASAVKAKAAKAKAEAAEAATK